MNQIILASHGSMAKGIKNALEMIIGNAESVKAFLRIEMRKKI